MECARRTFLNDNWATRYSEWGWCACAPRLAQRMWMAYTLRSQASRLEVSFIPVATEQGRYINRHVSPIVDVSGTAETHLAQINFDLVITLVLVEITHADCADIIFQGVASIDLNAIPIRYFSCLVILTHIDPFGSHRVCILTRANPLYFISLFCGWTIQSILGVKPTWVSYISSEDNFVQAFQNQTETD